MLPLAALLALVGACSGGLGDVCSSDPDCRAGLRCSARGSIRGVCVYDDALADGAPTLDLHQPDQSIDVDAAPSDLSRDAGEDRGDSKGDSKGDGDRDLSDTLPDTAAGGSIDGDGAGD